MNDMKENETFDKNMILPYRNIPFDIGVRLDPAISGKVKEYLLTEYEEYAISRSLSAISKDILFAFQIRPEIRLYIYRFGIGVFTVEDDIFNIDDNSRYAIEYCRSRKEAHDEYLCGENKYTALLRNIIRKIRQISAQKTKDQRFSASEDWENKGLSYVMTVSFFYIRDGVISYDHMDDIGKKNIQIMLEPSIAHEEDSIIVRTRSGLCADPYDFDLSSCDTPKDWVKSSDYSVYISWAAVIVCSKTYDKEIQMILEALEVDLQSMWMYVYCLYEDLNTYRKKRKKLASELRSELYSFNRRYNEFLSISDPSVPSYIANIRSELIKTSGISEYAEKYIEYLKFCIDETESKDLERQKKYSWLNEILLFIIAFVQIAPMLYQFMTGGLGDVEILPVIVMAAIVITAIIIIVKKN